MYTITKHLYSQWIKGTLTVLFFFFIAFTGCELPLKTADTSPVNAQTIMFDYATTMEVSAQGTFHSGSGNVLSGVPFKLYTEIPTGASLPFAQGVSNESGTFSITLNLPTAVNKIYLQTNYIGLPSLYELPVMNKRVIFDEANVINVSAYSLNKSGSPVIEAAAYVPPMKYLGTWKSDGTPNYLLPARDVIDAGLLARLNESLPEYLSVVKTHPEYLTASDKSTIITERADVWVTFIHEGAGYLNVLGFYTYPVGKAPASTRDIDSITIIFPNVSYSGSGGGLKSGDKVYLGQFNPNTAIGWVIFSNGYSGGKIGTGNWMLFSNQALNGVTNTALQQHNVLLNDVGFDRVVLGIEDIKRDTGGDQDFNDCMFSVTSNPVKAIALEGLALIDVPIDKDGDGVTDTFDEFPNDPLKAYSSYTPALNQYNTLAFEDLWPGRGDEDYNDLVVGYNTRTISNAQNKVVSLEMKYVVRAIGATYALGFGFELPIDPSAVQSVVTSRPELSKQPLSGNGTEAGQQKATVILFDDAYAAIRHTGSKFVNTDATTSFVTPETIHVNIELKNPVLPSALGTAPFNPFIFVNKRSKEVHLANKPPTMLADVSYFGTSFDKSSAAKNTYYLSREGKPWGLNIPGEYAYPIERTPIQSAYLNFDAWAKMSGAVYTDWYSTKSGYRDAAKLWKKK